jgi:hypothetical protein
LEIKLGNYTVRDTFYVVDLSDTDVVLGVQWLITLGKITTNYQTLEMGFRDSDGKRVVLRGMSIGAPRTISAKWVEGCLRNYMGGQHHTWVRWLHMGEYCYNTTHHMSIRMSPFRALYGYNAPTFVQTVFGDSTVPGAKDWVEES